MQFKPAHPSCFLLNLRHAIIAALIVLLSMITFSARACAEARSITAEGEYRMSDRDIKEDAVRLEETKRKALDQVASCLVVRNFDVTQDEIRSYTTGVVVALDQKIRTRLDNETIVVRVTLTAQVPSVQSSESWNKPPSSRRLDSVYQLNPLLPAAPASGSEGHPPIVIQQVAPPPTRPPWLHTVPHMPQQSAPSSRSQSPTNTGADPSPQDATLQPEPQSGAPRNLSPQVPQLLQSPQKQPASAPGTSDEGQ